MFKPLAATAVAAIGLAAAFSFPFRTDDIAARHRDMLNPSVRVTARLDGGVSYGSGTVVHSGADGTFVLTNDHVVAAALAAQTADAGPLEVKVENWLFLDDGRGALPISVTATVVAHDAGIDLALLKVEDPEFRARSVARLAAAGETPDMGEAVFAVGGGIGNRPFITEGLMSLNAIGGRSGSKMLISSPIVPGNSGGGSYVKRGSHYVLFGVPEAVETVHDAIVPHMAVAIPMSTVRPFLASAGLSEFSTAPARPAMVAAR